MVVRGARFRGANAESMAWQVEAERHAVVDLNGPCIAQRDGCSVGVDVIEPAEAPLHRAGHELEQAMLAVQN